MRILHLYKAYPPVKGGIENTIELLAEAQAAAGHTVSVLVSASGPRSHAERRGGVEVIRLGRLTEVASAPLCPGLPWAVWRHPTDIAHLHAPFPPGEVAQLLWGRSRRTVITWHSDVVRQRRILRFYAPLLRRVLHRADRVFATSEAYLRRSPYLREVSDRCTVIPLGVRLAPFGAPDASRAARLRLAWSSAPDGSTRAVILFVGRLRAYKGLPFLVQAMHHLSANLVIAGDGPEAARLRRLVAREALGDRVRFVGHLSDADLPAAYQAADVFVLPSHLPSEAFGLVLVEAMASGLPVVCTELGTGTSEVVRHQETGLVVPPADVRALEHAIAQILSDDTLRRRLGEAGRRRAAEQFSADTYVARTLAAYQELLER